MTSQNTLVSAFDTGSNEATVQENFTILTLHNIKKHEILNTLK